MSWPTTSISTQHLDANTDNPTLARADILQMVQQVNSMRDVFAPNGASTGDLLSYQGGQFVPRSTGLVFGEYENFAIVSLGNASGVGSNTNFTPGGISTNRVSVSADWDGNGIANITNGCLVLSSGVYMISNASRDVSQSGGATGYNTADLYIATGETPTSNAALIKLCPNPEIGVAGSNYYNLSVDVFLVRTVNTTETISFWTDGNFAGPKVFVHRLS